MNNKIRLYVDFNEMVEEDLVLLSKEDYKQDSEGDGVYLHDGLRVAIYMDDKNELGERDNLLAEGIVQCNQISEGWGSIAKWCCRLDEKGIYHESDVKNHE